MAPATDIEIAEAWVRMHKAGQASQVREANFWAYIALDELGSADLERCWTIINEIMRIDESDFMLSNLAAGPVEDLLVNSGCVVINRIEANAKSSGRFRAMLGMVWKNEIPNDIWERVERAAL